MHADASDLLHTLEIVQKRESQRGRFMKNSIRIIAILSILFSAFLVGPAGAAEIKWGTATAGGMWQTLGTAMLEDVLKADPSVKGSTLPVGGAANLIGIAGGKLNIAFSFSDTSYDAWEGKGFFEGKGKIRNIRALAALFPEPTQFAVFADSGITEISQLKGKKIAPGPKGGSTELVTRRILEMYGITYKDVDAKLVSFSEGGQLMIDKHIDAILYGAMLYPAPALVNVSSQRPIRLLSLSDEVVEKMVKTYKGLEPFTLAPGSYKGVDYPVKGLASLVNIVVHEEMPEGMVYAITKTIAENIPRYQSFLQPMTMMKTEDMPKDAGIPFHPGAMRYYKERGWVK